MPGKRNVLGATKHLAIGEVWEGEGPPPKGEFRQAAVCCSPDAATAWAYSHGAWGTVGDFDLWQFTLEPEDDVEVLRQWGARIVEVRVYNRVKKSRLVWLGERTVRG